MKKERLYTRRQLELLVKMWKGKMTRLQHSLAKLAICKKQTQRTATMLKKRELRAIIAEEKVDYFTQLLNEA